MQCDGGSGTAASNVTTVSIACTNTIGGTISGLVGTGLVLQDNNGDNLTVKAGATSFTFATAISGGAAYKVSVLTQPSSPVQSCVVTAGSGTASGNVTTVSIACTTTTYTIGGMISGLAGTGLVLEDNGGDSLPVTANGSFTFPTPIDSGDSYNVTVQTQPAGENCVVSAGTGTATSAVSNIGVACTSSTYTVGGTVTGLAGTGLMLQNNGTDTLTIANPNQVPYTFTFATALADGTAYSVTVSSQPTSPAQSCVVTSGGAGTSSVNVTNVQVTCSNLGWTWESGSNLTNQLGTYGSSTGTVGIPGARYQGNSWIDAKQNFWLFGGRGFASVGTTAADLNDLWEYNGTSELWTWVGGADVSGAGGTYGSIGVAATTNYPGARDSAVSWTDASGNFWFFGGHGYDSTATADNLNDLWMYNPTGCSNPTGCWTWVSGSETVDQLGVYGTQGVAASTNIPGARYSPVSWIDKSGNFWLFGGRYDTGSTANYLNDLWRYNPTGCSNPTGCWTWVSGSSALNSSGTYGSFGRTSSSSVPGARYLASSWTDSQGNLWLFGGFGFDSVGDEANLSDLWEYNIGSNVWTWMGGPEVAAINGTYGTIGTADGGNIPGSREGAVSWTDPNGNFWLFGGVGVDSVAKESGELNDLWEYSPTAVCPDIPPPLTMGCWTWQNGSNLIDGVGSYGTLGVADPSNVPGARGVSASWTDPSGNLWLFGGNGPSSGAYPSFNDLWKFVP